MHDCVEFRKLAPDLAAPLAVFFEAIRNAGDDKTFHPHPFTQDEAARLACYAGKDLYYAIVEDDAVIGYGMLRGWDEGYDVPSLGIALHPSARGSGLASAFMHFLHAAAKRRGARRIRLKVYSGNERAVRLYKGLNYIFGAEEAGQLVGTVDLI